MFSAIVNNPITRLVAGLVVFGIFVSIVIAFLPEIAFEGEFENAFIWLFETLWSFDWLLPIGTMVSCFVIIISAEIGMLILNFYFWIKSSISK